MPGQQPTTVDSIGAMVDHARHHTSPRHRGEVVNTLLDTVGVAVAARYAPSVEIVREWAAGCPGEVPVWGTHLRLAADRAALVNGTASHALDYDDAGLSMPLHPSAVLWPAVLALAGPETHFETLLAAVESGHVIIRALSDVLPIQEHYDRGWHASSTLGVLAAAAVGSAVAGLEHEEAAHAVGLAASTAAGSLANFGTMTKPLHVGRAAQDAVAAVQLAAAGFTSDPTELDAPRGFLRRYGNPTGADLHTRLEHWAEEWPQDCAVKRYSSCFGTHRAVLAAVRLHPEVDGRAIESVVVEAHPSTLRPLIDRTPTTGDEARFSMEFTVAHALRTGSLGPGDFTPLTIAAARGLMDVVHVIPAEKLTGTDADGGRFARVAVTLTDGTLLERTVTLQDPADRPNDADVDAKVVACLRAADVAAEIADGFPARMRALRAGTAADLDPLLSHQLSEEKS